MAYNSFWTFLLFSGIFILLCLGVVSDFRTREVSNKITFGVLGLSVPLIAWNMANIGFWNFAYLGVFFMAYLRGMGMADLKVIFPLLFIFKEVGIFAGVLAALFGVYLVLEYYRNDKRTSMKKISLPYFLPITLAFVFMVII